ncbi:MAG: DsbA family protein [Nanoarchaeota archaeon]|nr:DsbA family protein [Nanoarchaeota archaeon]
MKKNWKVYRVEKEEIELMSETIQIKKDTFYKGSIVVLAVLLIVSIFTGGFGTGGTGAVTQNPTGGTPAQGTGGAAATANVGVITNNPELFPALGPANAEDVVIELSDYQCPYCTLASGIPEWTKESQYQQYSGLIGAAGKVKELAENGEIRFIYVPLAFLGDESIDAAQAAYCAGDQGKYFEMHDAIFAASTGPTEHDGKYSKANLKLIAQGVEGIDTNAFNSCLDSDKNKAKVEQATSIVQGAGFQISTPQFWVNGQQSQASWTAIQAAINQ